MTNETTMPEMPLHFTQLIDGSLVYTADQLRAYAAAAVAMERERFVSLLTEKRDAATVSKYATSRDCVTARSALDDAINAIRQGA